MYALYLLKKSDRTVLDKILGDDIIGRQTVTQKDAAIYGLKDDSLLILYEGSDAANSRLKEQFGKFLTAVEESKAKAVYQKIKDEESQAEGGMGFLFR